MAALTFAGIGLARALPVLAGTGDGFDLALAIFCSVGLLYAVSVLVAVSMHPEWSDADAQRARSSRGRIDGVDHDTHPGGA